jgi:tetratricopeptide (TPR) repeat protein
VTSNLRPSSAQIPAKFQQAVECLKKGQLATARALCAEILKHQPNHADALHVAGVIALQSNDPRRAAELIGKALAVNPGNAAAHCNRASALQALNEWEAALDSYNAAIVHEPRFAEAYFNRGIVLHLLKRPDDAVASHSRAIALKSDFAAAYFHRGIALQELRQSEAALASYNQAIGVKPDYAEAHLNRGVVLRDLDRLEAALASYDQAIAINPRFAAAYSNRGNVQRQLGRWNAALASFDAAIAIEPDRAEAHCNRGNLLNELNRLDEAVASYDRAIAINGQYVEAHCNKAVAHLLAGDFAHGWVNYEWRRKRHPRRFAQPLWQGKKSIAGKTILIYSEQGYGDTLQFCRYIPRVAALGAQVIFEAEEPLMGLMATLPGVSQLVAKGNALPAFDCHCPLLTLPFAFNTTLETIPAPTRYLRADAAKVERWRAKLGDETMPRVGLVWAGSTVRNNNRSIALAHWVSHLPAGFEYVSLQKEVPPEDQTLLRDHPQIVGVAQELNDFGDTAALCECMDLVISIDTSVAHLCGALGKRTWVLLPFNPDWRWLLHRDDSPWYPSATLYRQATLGDWSGVYARIHEDLTRAFPSHGER